jgi:putative transposase
MIETVREVGPRLGVAPTCAALGLSPATYYRRTKPPAPVRSRPTPPRALGASERAAVLEVLHEPRFVDRAPAQVYAHLLDEGRYLCSPRTMYRVLATCQEVRERRDQLRPPRYTAPQLLATRPNEVWSWDITKLLGPVKWTYFYLCVILDIFSRYVVGWMVAHRESAQLAQRLIAETCTRQGIAPGTLTLHADRGSSMTSKPVALLLADLGVTKTHSRPYVSDDNPFSEAQFKTLKYRPDFPERFGSLAHARTHCRVFFPWYNPEHRHTGLGLLTPHDVHYGLADQRLAARAKLLTAAYAAHPERFVTGVPRPPARPTAVWINPPPATATSPSNPASAAGEPAGDAFRAPYSPAAESGGPDLRTETQALSITRLPAAVATEADEPAMTETALH